MELASGGYLPSRDFQFQFSMSNAIFNFKNHASWQKVKSMNHFVFLNFYFGDENARNGNSLVVRRVLQGRIIIVLF